MKFILWVAAVLTPYAVIAAPEPPLEVKVASIDAGKWLDPSDMSVIRIKTLLNSTQTVYSTPQTDIADMAAKAKEMARSKNLSVAISDLLDFSLVACETKCTRKQFVDYLSNYIVVRSTSGQSHHQTTRGLVILSNVEKRLSK